MTYVTTRKTNKIQGHFSLYKHKNSNISNPNYEQPSMYINSSSYLIFEDFNQQETCLISQKRTHSVTSSNAYNGSSIDYKKPKFRNHSDDSAKDEMYHHPSVKKPMWTWNNLYINAEVAKTKQRTSSTDEMNKSFDNNDSFSDKSGYTTPTTKSDFSEFMIKEKLKNDSMVKLRASKKSYSPNEVIEDDFFSDDSCNITAEYSDTSSLSYQRSIERLSDRSPYLITLKDLIKKGK